MGSWKVLPAVLAFALGAAADPAHAVECTTIPGNAVASCGFESAGALSDWSQPTGTPAFAAGLGENGGALRGTSANFGAIDVFGLRSQCFTVTPGQVVPLGYAVSLVSGTAPSCTAGWQQWSDLACTNGAGGAIGVSPTVPGAGYSAVADSRTVDSGIVAMSLLIDCRGSGAFELLIDNVFAIAPQAPRPSVSVPTLGEAMLLALALVLGAVASTRLARNRVRG